MLCNLIHPVCFRLPSLFSPTYSSQTLLLHRRICVEHSAVSAFLHLPWPSATHGKGRVKRGPLLEGTWHNISHPKQVLLYHINIQGSAGLMDAPNMVDRPRMWQLVESHREEASSMVVIRYTAEKEVVRPFKQLRRRRKRRQPLVKCKSKRASSFNRTHAFNK